jgi:hypothetical protein
MAGVAVGMEQSKMPKPGDTRQEHYAGADASAWMGNWQAHERVY